MPSTKFASHSHSSSNDMTLVSNSPSWWPFINSYRIYSYFAVAASVGMIYDWALTFGQEFELVWKQRWSLMTVLYLSARYLGISYAVITILFSVPTIPVTDAVSLIMYLVLNWTNVVVTAILGVIMVTRLYAMYQRSRNVLIFLIIAFLAVNIFDVAIFATTMWHISSEELILSGNYQCTAGSEGDAVLLVSVAWIITTVWEVLALCLAVWVAVKHFRELRRHSAGGIIGDSFMVLIKSHAVYFASLVAVSCFNLGALSPTISNISSLETQIYIGSSQIFVVVQSFVLGPRLILSVREHHAKRVADNDAAIGMTSLAFQERVHVSTSSSV
ncbi:hypothetical protein BDR03DRAFT_571619 [Suillus americanus]|nr:hypothetical protein BDR03DRAFT_571619 [Suillus americanus]